MRLRTKFAVLSAVLALVAAAAFFCRPIFFFNQAMFLREALSGVSSRTINISGHRIHYLVEGPDAGPAIVLVHGLGGRVEDWRNLAPELARAGFRVYMPDLLGFGKSDAPADFSYSIDDESALVVAFMDALNLHQPDLGGWSMGGWIAQWIAVHHPDRVRRLVLFDSAGLAVQPLWNTALFTPRTADEVAELNALLMPNPSRVPAFVARDLLRFSRDKGWIIQRATASMLTGRNTTDQLLPRLKMPVLLVWGDQDRIMPIDQAQTMHRLIPQSQLDIASGCGHLAPVQCSAQIAPRLIAFLKQ